MSAAAVVCPFCGKRQVERDPCSPKPAAKKPGLQGVALSREEVSALLATDRARDGDDGDRPGMFASLFFPHPRASGARRLVEVVLIVASLPLIAGMLLLLLRRRRRSVAALTREADLVLAGFIGAPIAYVGLTHVLALSSGTALALASAGAVATAMRVVLAPK